MTAAYVYESAQSTDINLPFSRVNPADLFTLFSDGKNGFYGKMNKDPTHTALRPCFRVHTHSTEMRHSFLPGLWLEQAA